MVSLGEDQIELTGSINVYDILRHDSLVMTRGAVDAIARRLGQ